MVKQTVVTIHGVNPNRSWQPNVHKVLSPHFRCQGYDYNDYDTIVGPVRAIANISTLILAIISLVFIVREIFFQHWVQAGIGAFVFVVLFTLSLLLGWRRRLSCARRLKIALETLAPDGSPNIIAHSLGTFLIGHVLQKYPDLRLGNVVLVSNVLPRNFPWSRLLTQRPSCVSGVRSEFGTADLVVRAVGKIRWLARDLGDAGAFGFKEIKRWTHTLKSPVLKCDRCDAAPAKVHNVPLREFEHSEVFLGSRHARELWLPIFWNSYPEELSQYLQQCRWASELQTQKRWNEAAPIIEKIWSTEFTWTHKKPLDEFVKDLVSARCKFGPGLRSRPITSEIIRDAKQMLHRVTARAWAESIKEGEINENIVIALHPNRAIAKVVAKLIKEYE
jgi:hypothetical protein